MKLSKAARVGWTKEQSRLYKQYGTLPDFLIEKPVEESVPADILSQEKITVLCVKFGTRYGRPYVEKLRNMVSRHLSGDYEFVCLTDDRHPIDGVRSIIQPIGNYRKLWWHKIHMFDPSLPLNGRILYFDLDVIIHRNINKLFVNQGELFLGIRDFNRKFQKSWQNLNSSVMSWVHGTQSQIFSTFQNNQNEAQRLHGDQDYIWRLSKDKIKFWPDEWIQSYKWEIRNRSDLSYVNGKRIFKTSMNVNIDPQCCVTVFHGDPKPEDITDPFVIDNWR